MQEADLASPLVRTNPVTGWKGIFTGVNSLSAGHINGVTERENEILKDYCSSRPDSFVKNLSGTIIKAHFQSSNRSSRTTIFKSVTAGAKTTSLSGMTAPLFTLLQSKPCFTPFQPELAPNSNSILVITLARGQRIGSHLLARSPFLIRIRFLGVRHWI